MNRMRADLTLFVVAFIWGTAFIAQKNANENMGPFSFVGARFLVSWIAVMPLALHEHNQNARCMLNKRDIGFAAIIGLCLFVGASLQQIGLVTTTASNGGFLTTIYVVFVPLIVWAITGAKPPALILLAGVLAIAGASLLGEKKPLSWTSGDALLLVADVAWAAEIALIPIFQRRVHRPFFLAFAQYGVVAVLALAAGLTFEHVSKEEIVLALPSILYAGVCSGGIAYTLQILAQQYTPPAEAALIMSFESIFAAIGGATLLSERLRTRAIVGCALILLSVLVVEGEFVMRWMMAPIYGRCPLGSRALSLCLTIKRGAATKRKQGRRG